MNPLTGEQYRVGAFWSGWVSALAGLLTAAGQKKEKEQ